MKGAMRNCDPARFVSAAATLCAVAVLLAGCGFYVTRDATTGSPVTIIDTPWAGAACSGWITLSGEAFTLDAAFDVSAATAASWEAVREPAGALAVSSLQSLAPTSRVAVCYIDGDLATSPLVDAMMRAQGLKADRGMFYLTETGQFIQGPVGAHQQIAVKRP